MSKIISEKEITVLDEQMGRELKELLQRYAEGKINKAELTSLLKQGNAVNLKAGQYVTLQIKKDPLLKGVKYRKQYDEIIVETDGKADTVLSARARPILITGESFLSSGTVLLEKSRSLSTSYMESKTDNRKNIYTDNPKIAFKQSKYINVSSWKLEIFKRMGGIFLLACGLLITVVILFYLIFRALLSQKKLTDIKTDFANNITHELKTPLSSVELILKSLARKEVRNNPEKTDELLTLLNRQHYKLKHIVDSVLESAMSEELVPELKNTDITGFLNQYVTHLTITSHPLKVNILRETCNVRISDIGMEKILDNLLENAVKYSDEGKLITITAYAKYAFYFIEITDSGPGIEAQYRGQIFEKFVRITEQNKHTVKGLGLGLYLSKIAVQQMNGTISVSSKTGHGSTFMIKLPTDEN